jgi:undecaprenyl diphosphate synthase
MLRFSTRKRRSCRCDAVCNPVPTMSQQVQQAIRESKEQGRFPRHVALIMDGNGRWAKKRMLPRSAGHRQGVEALRRTIRAAGELSVEYLTIFSFSSENWSRPREEITDLLDILRRFIRQDVAELHAAGVRIKIIGERQGLEPDIVSLLEESEKLTRHNTGMTLVVAFNYGGRQEIARAAQRIAQACLNQNLDPLSITPQLFADYLDTQEIPDPDLIIRTSGEERLSNFLLWQGAYAELVFVEEHWPDFNKDLLERAIESYLSRDRRFGGIRVQAR